MRSFMENVSGCFKRQQTLVCGTRRAEVWYQAVVVGNACLQTITPLFMKPFQIRAELAVSRHPATNAFKRESSLIAISSYYFPQDG